MGMLRMILMSCMIAVLVHSFPSTTSYLEDGLFLNTENTVESDIQITQAKLKDNKYFSNESPTIQFVESPTIRLSYQGFMENGNYPQQMFKTNAFSSTKQDLEYNTSPNSKEKKITVSTSSQDHQQKTVVKHKEVKNESPIIRLVESPTIKLVYVGLMENKAPSEIQRESSQNSTGDQESELMEKRRKTTHLLKGNYSEMTRQPQTILAQRDNYKNESPTIKFVESPTIELFYEGPMKNSRAHYVTHIKKLTDLAPNKNNSNLKKAEFKINKMSTKLKEPRHMSTTKIKELNRPTPIKNEAEARADTNITDMWFLSTNNASSIMERPSKYFYNSTNPIYPETQSNSMKIEDTRREKSRNVHQSFIAEKIKPPPETSGPPLYPQSSYIRQFELPFFLE